MNELKILSSSIVTSCQSDFLGVVAMVPLITWLEGDHTQVRLREKANSFRPCLVRFRLFDLCDLSLLRLLNSLKFCLLRIRGYMDV